MLNREMKLTILSPLVFSTLLFSLLQTPSYAAKQSYIVYLGESSYSISDAIADDSKVTQSHYDLLATLSQAQSVNDVQTELLYSYTKCMNGFAAVLDDIQAEQLRNLPGVKQIFLNLKYDLHTTHSWDFVGLESHGTPVPSSLWDRAKYGQDVIIANLDTGVWPESPSFSDEGMGPVPSRWRGSCEPDSQIRCNKKLIGARVFYKGAQAAGDGPFNKTSITARDNEGHGSHTLSTAGGSFVPGASIFGYGNGTAKGGSPKARVAAYKICWTGGCYGADILAGFDAAMADGVDVISASIGGPPVDLFTDPTAFGSFNAIKRGIHVIASGGNSGPTPETISNVAPWIFTIGASTMDRDFVSSVVLGDNKSLRGISLSDKSLPAGKFYPLISGADAKSASANASDAQLCEEGSLDKAKVAGKIIVCLRGDSDRLAKGQVVASLGAVGMILANDQLSANELLADPHFLPASHITYTDGQAVYNYIKTTKNPTASISPVKTEVGVKPAPVMASFSSRGPNAVFPGLLKPDVTAPGVNILAAYSGAISPSEEESDKRRVPFTVMSGTSMSCPHVSGIVGLLKSIHPDWSPAAVKSAIMTTAKTRANNGRSILDSDGKTATPFAYGAGHVRPNLAADPGLVYDLTITDYANSLCGFGYNESVVKSFIGESYTCPKNFNMADFNYPSITVANLNASIVVTRKAKNVGTPGTYTAHVKVPGGISVTVEPAQLTFTKLGEEKEYKVNLKASVNGSPKNYVFGQLVWSDGKHKVRSPLVVKHA
ncbi:Cucumisin precursor, putative [Ricinus communis]|uniref:Cucumisin, putative n=1 Tax=Ricinus communis TaxID=3988 RepID=B9SX95_RICCO|nr:Cucumisin precursor, putative [Ricinus communis]|eukprot:XP_002530614.1 subtilisin-like protease SBT5.4 [Ricinus communis]